MSAQARPIATRNDDVVAGVSAMWMLAGLFLDGWAHINDKPESFFTPWHGVFYSGFAAAAVWLLYVIRRHQVDGRFFRDAIPAGYGIRLMGVAIFAFGAMFDLIWHEVFGIEQDIAALLSPSHLTLLTGGVLLALGPVASTFARRDILRPAWGSTGAVVAAITFLLSTLQFFLMYVSPYEEGSFTRRELELALLQGRGWLHEQVMISGVTSILLFTLTTTGAVVWLLRNVPVPRGALAMVFIVPAFLQTVLSSLDTAPRLLGPIAAGLVAEVTWPSVRTHIRRGPATAPIWLAVLTLITWYGVFFGVLAEGRVGWDVDFWTGVPVLAALFAALMTLIAFGRGSMGAPAAPIVEDPYLTGVSASLRSG